MPFSRFSTNENLRKYFTLLKLSFKIFKYPKIKKIFDVQDLLHSNYKAVVFFYSEFQTAIKERQKDIPESFA